MPEEIIIDYKKECSNLLAEKNALLCRYEEIREQLKQAENTVNKCHKYLAELEDKIESLEQENKVLKDNNNHLQVIIDDGRAENIRFREENKELKSETLQWKQIKDMANNNKYRSALEEIRKVLTNEYYIDTVKAIHKINEVLNEKEL